VSGRVTLFINSLRGGGAERVCVTLANELCALGWSVQVLVLNLRDAVVRSELHPEVPVIDLGVEHVRYGAFAVARYVRSNRPDQFLVFNHQLAILLVWLRAIHVGRFSIIARNISTLSRKAQFEPSFWHGNVVPGLTALFYRHADLVIAQSQGMLHDLVSNYGVDERRVKVIHNPLAARFTRPLVAGPVPWLSRREEVLYVGRLDAIKGLGLLVAACAICMRSNPDLVLRLVGAGNQVLALQRQAAAAGIADRVIFEGYAMDTVDFCAQTKVLALTSHYEGFPNVLVEALSQGTPVVSVDCASGPAEIVEDGRNGILVRDRDADTFAAALDRALAGPWDVGDVRRTAERFSSREIARQYAAALADGR
jgi:glycosyltransferase involved in cell wall biosynthesis